MSLFRRETASLDALIVGLGNPGRQYARTRHNIGFMVVDELAARLAVTFRARYEGRFAEGRDGEARIALLEPETFMNLSGRPVAAAARYYRLAPEEIVVVYDDIELAPGRIRAKAGGGLKGHNGLRSIAGALGSPDFVRVRMGVGRPGPGDRRSVADFVLAPFAPEEDVEGMVRSGVECIETILRDGLPEAERRWP